MSTLSWPSAKSFDRFPLDGSVLVSTLGLVFVLSGVAFWSQSLLPAAETVSEALYELVMRVLFGLVILVLGIHIERSELVPEERWEVILWCFSAFLFFFWLAVWSQLDAVLSSTLTRDLVSDVVVFGSIGGAFGGIIGVNRGRATRNGILAERTEDQRETLELLTRLLRHDIRNDMQAISAHAGFLEDEVTEEGTSSLAVIEQRSDAVLRLLEDISTLLETLGSDRELRPVSLKSVIDREVSSLRDSHPALTVETTVPDDLQVVADGLLHQLFLNLLTNAVAHNDPETLTVTIDAASNGELAEITVRDDGSGIPEEIEETLFELGKKGPGSSGDGLGLYLVSRLVDLYGGTVAPAESPSGGARFDITLPAAD
jgi:signal transduction histidine kinase